MLTSNGRAITIAPQALAELNPILPESYYYASKTGLQLERCYALYGQIYSSQPWVMTVINKRAEALARLPVNVWDIGYKNGLQTKTFDKRSAYARLIANPSPKMDPFSFWGWVQRTIDIYGETYLAISRDGNGAPYQLLPMHPSRVAIKRAKTGEYTYYFMAGAGTMNELVHFPEEDVVPFKLFNPEKLERGMSKMEALRSTLFAEDSSRTATSAMWKNAGRPNLVLETENRLGAAGRERLRMAFDQAHAGSGNAGKTLVLEDGVTAKAVQVTAVEMQYIEARQLNREEVCGVYDIAPPIVHILDRATFSNISAQMRAFYRDTMAPVIEFIQSVMNHYVGSYWERDNRMEFAVDDVVRGDFEVITKAAHEGIAVGLFTPNEAREMVGMNRYDDAKADKLYANSAIQELGLPAEQIRLQGQVSGGTTPDGTPVSTIPAQTPVASLDGSKPNAVPSAHPQAGLSRTADSRPKPKHYREIKAQVGRGRTLEEIQAFALALAKKAESAEELQDILLAVELAIQTKGTTT